MTRVSAETTSLQHLPLGAIAGPMVAFVAARRFPRPSSSLCYRSLKMKAAFAIVAALPLLAAAARGPLPDLVPAYVGGSGTQVTIRVRNQGTAAAPAAFVRVLVGAPVNVAKNAPEPALAPGQVNSVIVPFGQSLKGAPIMVRVDGTGVIAESNENNNLGSATGT
jgi:CARDB protein